MSFHNEVLVLAVVTSANEVNVFGANCLFDRKKNYWPDFRKLGDRVKHGPRKNSLNIGADLNHRVDTLTFPFINIAR